MAFVATNEGPFGEWWKRLVSEGLVPADVRRVIIDSIVGEPVKVYYECYADEKMFDVDLAKAVVGAEAISVTEASNAQELRNEVDA